jgi:hypothetical protein
MFDGPSRWLLFDRYRLRRLRETLGRSVADFAVDIEEDPERTALVSTPFESMEDVRDRLERLEALLLEQSDRRAVFLTIYTEMTRETIRSIESGEFIDPAWMERYLVRFAEYYRRAFRNYERGAIADVPDPWTVAFGTAFRGDALVIQDALLGINAHINFDLALTLSDIGLDPDRPDKYADHTRINEILHRLVSVQQELLSERYAPGLSRVGDRLGELDDMVAGAGLRTAREKAWQVAVLRSDVEWLPTGRYTRWLLGRTATGGAYLLLQPKASPETMQVLRDIEADEFDLPSYARTFHDRAGTVR